jgi:homoprotocatechuate degradation regulator HpaR
MSATPIVTSRKNLPLLLLQTREAMMRRFRRVLKTHGLTDQQWRVLRAIADAGAMTSGQIAQECCMLGPSLTGVLSRMESAGWLERARSTTDHRRVAVMLSQTGRELVDAVMPDVEEVYQDIEIRLGKERVARLSTELVALVVALEDGAE